MNPTLKIDITNQCVICYNQFKINTTPPNVSLKMFKLCRKYLHSDIMKETLAAKWDISEEDSLVQFCQNCFESAVELNDLTEQMEFLQKSISELTLMFSMGILSRRSTSTNPNGKVNSDGKVSKKLIEMDCTGLTECGSWNRSLSTSRLPTKEPYLELAVGLSDSKTNEYEDPLYGIDEDEDSYMEMNKQGDEMDDDDFDTANKPTKSPVYFPSAAYFTTENDSKMPPVVHINNVPPPMHKTVVLRSGSSGQPVLSEPPPVETKNRRKTKLVPIEIAEESNSSTAESNAEEKVAKRLYHLDPKSVQPGRDRRRVQKALNCYRYRLKKKREAEQTIGKLHSDIANLKAQLQAFKQNGNTRSSRR